MADAVKERLSLTVTEVKEIEKVGKDQIPKLSFKAKDKDGKEAWYFTFKRNSFTELKPDTPLDGDFEFSEDEYGIKRKLIQLYKDGQPVGGERRAWTAQSDSPEKRRSIERQTSLQIAVQMTEPSDNDVPALLKRAEQIYDWLATGKSSKVEVSTPQAAVRSVSPAPEQSVIDLEWFKETWNTLPIEAHKQIYQWMKDNGAKGLKASQMAASLKEPKASELMELITSLEG